MANRIYIENDNAKITLRPDFLVDIEMYSGLKYEGLEPRRLFPLTGGDRYITLLDSDKNEVAMIRNLNNLMTDSIKAVKESLNQYYMIPKIKHINDITESFGIIRVNAKTDRGDCYFEINNRSYGIKVMYDGRILLRDSDDNRYEIPDIGILDRKALDIFLI